MGVSNSRSTLRVAGMTCAGCETKIERILSRLNGVSEARGNFGAGTVTVSWDSSAVNTHDMAVALEKAGYVLDLGSDDATNRRRKQSSVAPKANMSPATPAAPKAFTQPAVPVPKADIQPATPAPAKPFGINQILGILIVLIAVYFLISRTIGFNFIPEVSQNMSLGMLFVVGLLTSIHCVAMCGGINMSQCMPVQVGKGTQRLVPSALYNLGRVISYTLVGGLAGALGSAVSFSGWARGIVAVASGVFMVVMGLSMMGLPWFARIAPRMPRFLRVKAGEAGKGRGPLVVGLLNGLMPCGPLQAMQLYALGTGSFLLGASSMLVFSLGTVPLMFGLGALSSVLSSRFTARMMKVSAALVLLLGFVMVGRGLALSGVNVPDLSGPALDRQNAEQSPNGATDGTVVDGVQNVEATITSGGYPNITVTAGTPVRLNFKAAKDSLNGCNRTLVIPKFNKQVDLIVGDNFVEFTPNQPGTIPYSCWMGMITGKITVVAGSSSNASAPGATQTPAATDLAAADFTDAAASSCCADDAKAVRFQDGKVPVDDIQIAKEENGVQIVEIHVNDEGYSPAAAVVQRGAKVIVRFVGDKLNGCNDIVVFPEFNGSLNLSAGEVETPELTAESDFTFECAMSMLHGYVKVVDDLSKVNIEEVKTEIRDYVPAGGGGMACCQ